jgi:hypothetical protein
MALDANLNAETCVYMQAAAGDTGPAGATSQRTVPAVWWLSPDIQITAPDGTVNVAKSGNNTVGISYRFKMGCSVPNNRVKVDCWVGNPNLTMTPSSNTVQIAAGLIHTGMPGNVQNTRNFTWNLTPSSNPSDPTGEGHKCLIACVYPSALSPDGMNFYAADDCHYAQRNICIVKCNSPCGLTVETTNPNPEERLETTILAIADLRPTRHVLSTALQSVQQYDGFETFSKELPPLFEMRFEDFPDAKIRNFTDRRDRRMFGRYRAPNFSASFVMEPKQTTRFEFLTDSEGIPVGQANIIHLMHMSGKQVIGGLTVVLANGLKDLGG